MAIVNNRIVSDEDTRFQDDTSLEGETIGNQGQIYTDDHLSNYQVIRGSVALDWSWEQRGRIEHTTAYRLPDHNSHQSITMLLLSALSLSTSLLQLEEGSDVSGASFHRLLSDGAILKGISQIVWHMCEVVVKKRLD